MPTQSLAPFTMPLNTQTLTELSALAVSTSLPSTSQHCRICVQFPWDLPLARWSPYSPSSECLGLYHLCMDLGQDSFHLLLSQPDLFISFISNLLFSHLCYQPQAALLQLWVFWFFTCVVLRIKTRASCMLGKCFSTEPHSQACWNSCLLLLLSSLFIQKLKPSF